MMSHTASQENASAGQQALIAAAATATLRSLVNAVGATKRRLLQQTPKLSPTCSVLALALWCVTLLLVLGELERAQAMELRRRVSRAPFPLATSGSNQSKARPQPPRDDLQRARASCRRTNERAGERASPSLLQGRPSNKSIQSAGQAAR